MADKPLLRSESGWRGKWPDPSLPWALDYDSGVQPLAETEQGPGGGCALLAYLCPAGKWTNGWGETDGVVRGQRWTRAYADARFCDAIDERARQVLGACTLPPSANELAAMVRLQYNIGHALFVKSSVLKAHNRGDHAEAARAFLLFTKSRDPATGKFRVPDLPGLVTRRHEESALYLKPEDDEAPQRMPQAVAPQTSLAKSPTMTTGGALAGVGAAAAAIKEVVPASAPPMPRADAVATLAGVGEQATTVSTSVQAIKSLVTDALPMPASWILPGTLIVGGGVIMYRRWRARQQGVN